LARRGWGDDIQPVIDRRLWKLVPLIKIFFQQKLAQPMRLFRRLLFNWRSIDPILPKS
jgi:hypothetical protein